MHPPNTGSAGRQRGYAIAESLVAALLLAILIAGSSQFLVTVLGLATSARGFTVITAEIGELFEKTRANSFRSLLEKFGHADLKSIPNGATVTENGALPEGRATYVVTYVALKSVAAAAPEAVRVRVDVAQRRGRLGEATYEFETVVSGVGS